jgi:hypothetical protein
MSANIWDLLERLFKPVLSTAMHDIYNEINNIFFLYESTLMSCKCMSEEQKREIQQDFFTIMEHTKAKQFVFNNICSEKLFTPQEFAKHVQSLQEIQCFTNNAIPLSILSIVFLMGDAKNPMVIREDSLSFVPKSKFITYLQKGDEHCKILDSAPENHRESIYKDNHNMINNEFKQNNSPTETKKEEINSLNFIQGTGGHLEWLPQLFLFTINKYNFQYILQDYNGGEEREIILRQYS